MNLQGEVRGQPEGGQPVPSGPEGPAGVQASWPQDEPEDRPGVDVQGEDRLPGPQSLPRQTLAVLNIVSPCLYHVLS